MVFTPKPGAKLPGRRWRPSPAQLAPVAGALGGYETFTVTEGDAEILGVARASMPRHVHELHAEVCLVVQQGHDVWRVPLSYWQAQDLLTKVHDIITSPITPLFPRKVAER